MQEIFVCNFGILINIFGYVVAPLYFSQMINLFSYLNL